MVTLYQVDGVLFSHYFPSLLFFIMGVILGKLVSFSGVELYKKILLYLFILFGFIYYVNGFWSKKLQVDFLREASSSKNALVIEGHYRYIKEMQESNLFYDLIAFDNKEFRAYLLRSNVNKVCFDPLIFTKVPKGSYIKLHYVLGERHGVKEIPCIVKVEIDEDSYYQMRNEKLGLNY